MNIDLKKAMNELENNGIHIESQRDSLEKIARSNKTTPMTVYGLIKKFENPSPTSKNLTTAEEIEAQYSGTCLGIKSLTEVCHTVDIDIDIALKKVKLAYKPLVEIMFVNWRKNLTAAPLIC